MATLNGQPSTTLLSNQTNYSSTSSKSRHNKYRTLNRIKGLFVAAATSAVGAKSEMDILLDLPPHQFKNEIFKLLTHL